MLAFAEDEARRRGHASIDLSTHEMMQSNLALYARWATSSPIAASSTAIRACSCRRRCTDELRRLRRERLDRPRRRSGRRRGASRGLARRSSTTRRASCLTRGWRSHVFGEHLGEWERGTRLLARLRERAHGDDARARGRRAASRRSATRAAMPRRSTDWASTTASRRSRPRRRRSRRAARSTARSTRTTRRSSIAAPGLADGSPAMRALAAGGNNLAAALEERDDRTARQTRGMVAAARAGARVLEARRRLDRGGARRVPVVVQPAARRRGAARRPSARATLPRGLRSQRRAGVRALLRHARARARRIARSAIARAFERMPRRGRARCTRSLPDDEREACDADLRALDDR